MSLEAYNNLISNIFNTRQVLTKTRSELEEREGLVKALLDSRVIGLFMSKGYTQRGGFKLIKLEKLILVRNMNGTGNSGDAIIHKVEVNLYFKEHVERVQMDMCNLGKTEVILGMPWLQAHNPEIDWEKEKVKIVRYPPICG